MRKCTVKQNYQDWNVGLWGEKKVKDPTLPGTVQPHSVALLIHVVDFWWHLLITFLHSLPLESSWAPRVCCSGECRILQDCFIPVQAVALLSDGKVFGTENLFDIQSWGKVLRRTLYRFWLSLKYYTIILCCCTTANFSIAGLTKDYLILLEQMLYNSFNFQSLQSAPVLLAPLVKVCEPFMENVFVVN